MSAIERIEQRLLGEEEWGDMAVPDVRISRREFEAALAEAWDAGAARGDSVGMDAIILNPMHANPWRKS